MPVRIKQYLSSPSTLVACASGLIMYFAYASTQNAWLNLSLIGVAAFIAVFLPGYSRLSNKLEEVTNQRFALVTVGRLSRFILQFSFNAIVFQAFVAGGVVQDISIAGLGGVLGIALWTTLASQGAQYLAMMAFNRGYGDLNRNIIVALALNIVATAAATTGYPLFKQIFVAGSLACGCLFFGVGVLSDIRSRFFPKRGIGIFFGTFNPFHVTHAKIIEQAIRDRGLDKVIIHPTIVPKLHARALQRGEIRVARVDGGLCVLERTSSADANVNYFPTGNSFYPPETRKLLVELALDEMGLSDRVEVLWVPDCYAEHGFHGVVATIRRLYPGVPLHGLHGSDLGGMWVRSIYDETGWIYPMPIKRTNGISATAIRNGAAGMTTGSVATVLAHLKAGITAFELNGRRFKNTDGLVTHTNQKDPI
jgi:hypothetical protein